MITLLDRVIGTHDDENLLGLLHSSELEIEPSKLVTQIREVLYSKLPFELVEEDQLVNILVESCPVVIVRALIYLDP